MTQTPNMSINILYGRFFKPWAAGVESMIATELSSLSWDGFHELATLSPGHTSQNRPQVRNGSPFTASLPPYLRPTLLSTNIGYATQDVFVFYFQPVFLAVLLKKDLAHSILTNLNKKVKPPKQTPTMPFPTSKNAHCRTSV